MFTVRRAEKRDVKEMTFMLNELFSLEKDFICDEAKQAAGLSLLIKDEKNCVLVCEYENGLAGMVTGQLVISTASGGYSVLLEDLIVKKKFRRKGCGTILLDSLIEWGRSKSAVRIQLLADSGNLKSLVFYKKHGFAESNMIGLYHNGI